MTPSNQIPAVCNYGTSAVYSDYPSTEQMRAGVVPLDSLPAAWWNKMWCASNCAINEARDMVGQIITEVNNVLCQAGINPQAACTDQLYQSINKIRQTLATASVPGAVVSSSVASEVAVDPTTGRMTVNCLGNAASLSTSASTVVGAINELKSTYDCCFSDTATALGGKAPTSHASSATTYGVGSADNYGHLKISDTYTSVLAACSGVAASQKALACVYAVACAAAAGNVSLGNTAGCALGTAAAGTAITAARSDHVHPKQTCVACAGQSYCIMDYYGNTTPLYIGYACPGLTCAQVTHLAAFSTNYTTGKTVIKDVAKDTIKSWLGLGSAAACGTRVGGSVTYVPYSGTDGCPLLTSNFLAYWNGAYASTGASNLRYYCGGTFGSAAKCDASAFLASNGCAYDSARLGTASSTCYLKVDGCTKVYLDTVYSRAPTENNTAKSLSFGTMYKNDRGQVNTFISYISGSNGYYYGNICGNVCGNAASADNANGACYAHCHYYSSYLKICHECQACSSCYYCCGRLFLCNTAGFAVRPILLFPTSGYNPPSSSSEVTACMQRAICCAYPWLFCDHIEFCTLRNFLGVLNSGVTSGSPRPPLVLQANQKLYLASSNIYWCCAACTCKVLGCSIPAVGYY